MFNKSGGKNGTPQKMGRNDQQGGSKVSKFYLELPQLDGEPVYLLEESLSIGSEEGDVIIDHDSVAPHHCTINLNQDILSVIDHGSKRGTKINKRAIPAGKMIILSMDDKIEIGSVRAQISVREESAPVMPPPFQYDKTGTKIKTMGLELEPPSIPLPSEEAVPDIPKDAAEQKPKKAKKAKKRSRKASRLAVSSTGASNGFLRVMGLICDALIIGVAHTLLFSEEIYRQLLNDLPSLAQEYLGPIYNDLLKAPLDELMVTFPEIEGALAMIKALAPENYTLWLQLAILLGLYRLGTSLILGVSLGQFLVGIRGAGSVLAKRLLAPLRWTFGLILLPVFWIADFPALFSKRTVKELLSFTRLETPSTVMAVLSMLIFMPLLIVAFLVGPALKGMKVPKPQAFAPMKKVELGVFDMQSIDSDSDYFSLGVPSEQVDYALPKFRFTQKGAKKSINPTLSLGKDQKRLELRLLRKIRLDDLFRKFTANNPMAEMKYPEITSFVNNSVITSKSIKAPAYQQIPIARETQKLLDASLGLAPSSVEAVGSFLMNNGPFIGAFMEFRNSLYSFMGEGAKAIKLRQLGNAIVIEGDYSIGKKVIKRYLPLNHKEAKLYEVTYDKGAKPAFLDLLAWNVMADRKEDAIAHMSFVDALLPGKKQNIMNIFQQTNEAYYALGKVALISDDRGLYKDLLMSIQSALQVLMENSQVLGLPEKASQKMSQNLNDLLKALKDKDMDFFGVRSVGVTNE